MTSRSFGGALFAACVSGLILHHNQGSPFSDASARDAFLYEPGHVLYQIGVLSVTSVVISIIRDRVDIYERRPARQRLKNCAAEFLREFGFFVTFAAIFMLLATFSPLPVSQFSSALLPSMVILWIALMVFHSLFAPAIVLERDPKKIRHENDWAWAMVHQFRRRAAMHRMAAAGSQTFILAVFAAGVYFFLSTDFHSTSQNAADLARNSEWEKQLDSTLERTRDAIIKKTGADSGEAIDATKYVLDIDNQFGAIALITKNDFYWSVSTRIGLLLLLYFAIQIFVTVYRFNVRLAAYYDARADVLQMSKDLDSPTLKDFVATFSPETLDFGRPPKSPINEFINVVKEVKSATETRSVSGEKAEKKE